jgi:DNA-binding MarR family transcriptional regulator
MVSAPVGESESHPTEGLDEIVHQRARLGILSLVHEARRVEFGYLLKTLGLTGGNLSQHLRVLEEASLIKVEKGVQGRRPRTWVSITPAGRRALLQEIRALRALVDRIDRGTDRKE